MAVSSKATNGFTKLKKWAFRMSGFNKYGLYFDDILYENDDVLEAIKRLTPKEVDERNFRQVRAAQLYIQKIRLPKDEWITFEQDRANRYLSPHLKEVIKERMEKEEWDANH